MLKVELIYDNDCPNVEAARRQLLGAFAETKLEPKWQEWDRADPSSPDHARAFGSPTILINGRDVAGIIPGEENNCCRRYRGNDGEFQGVPAAETIISALLNAQAPLPQNVSTSNRNWRTTLAPLPGIGVAMLPNLTCPACWPAYAGLLSALGLGFVNYTRYLLPLTALFLAVAVGSLAYRARSRREYKPMVLGAIAAAIVLIGRFGFASDPAMYAGIAMLIAASLWNSWPQRRASERYCPACTGSGPSVKSNKQIQSERRPS